MALVMVRSEQDSRADPEDVRLNRRDVDEFLGLCRAACADGEISQAELTVIAGWLRRSGRVESMPLVGEVQQLIEGLPSEVGDKTRAIVHDVLKQLTGDLNPNGGLTPTSLPLTVPPPMLTFEGKRYCFTGTFNFGSRAACENAVRRRGGLIKRRITLNTDVLVVGSEVTESWLHSSYGLKISTAVRWRQNDKVEIPLVSEEHWRSALAEFPATLALTDADLENFDDPTEMAVDLAAHGEISRSRFAEITDGLPFPEPTPTPIRSRFKPTSTAKRPAFDRYEPAPTATKPKKKSRYGWWLALAFVLSYLFAHAAFRSISETSTLPNEDPSVLARSG